MSIISLIQGGQLASDVADQDVVVPETALSFIETAAMTLRQSREIYLKRLPATDAQTDRHN